MFRGNEQVTGERYITVTYIYIDPAVVQRYRELQRLLAANGNDDPDKEMPPQYDKADGNNQGLKQDPLLAAYNEADALLREADKAFTEPHIPRNAKIIYAGIGFEERLDPE